MREPWLYYPTLSRCPSPEGYPEHCCYGEALTEVDGGKVVVPHNYLLQIYPDKPVFSGNG